MVTHMLGFDGGNAKTTSKEMCFINFTLYNVPSSSTLVFTKGWNGSRKRDETKTESIIVIGEMKM